MSDTKNEVAELPWRTWADAVAISDAKRDAWARSIIKGPSISTASGDSIVFIRHGEMGDARIYDCVVRRTLALHNGELVHRGTDPEPVSAGRAVPSDAATELRNAAWALTDLGRRAVPPTGDATPHD